MQARVVGGEQGVDRAQARTTVASAGIAASRGSHHPLGRTWDTDGERGVETDNCAGMEPDLGGAGAGAACGEPADAEVGACWRAANRVKKLLAADAVPRPSPAVTLLDTSTGGNALTHSQIT